MRSLETTNRHGFWAKTLLPLIPFLVCSVLSLQFGNVEPADWPDSRYPYGTQPYLDYFEATWFWTGVAISGALFGVVLIEEGFDWVERYSDRRASERRDAR